MILCMLVQIQHRCRWYVLRGRLVRHEGDGDGSAWGKGSGDATSSWAITVSASKVNGSGGVGFGMIMPSSTSGCGSQAIEASPPPEGEGWTPGQATNWINSSTLITGLCWTEFCRLCIIRIWPWCRLYSMDNKCSEVGVAGPGRTGVGAEGVATRLVATISPL